MINQIRKVLLALLLGLPALGHAQHLGPSAGYTIGTVKCEACAVAGFKDRLMLSGYSLGGDITGIGELVSVNIHYDRLMSKDKLELTYGHRNLELEQRLVKFLVGYGGVLDEKALLTVQFGFTIGKDYIRINREYPDGTISYGMESLRSGVYESMRPLSPILAVGGGYHIGKSIYPFVQIEKGFGKGFGDWEFHDWHFHKEESMWLSSGGSGTNTYLANDKLPNWKIELGVKLLFDVNP